MSSGEKHSRTARARCADPDAEDDEPTSPYVVVENGDDDVTVSVSVSAVGESARPIGTRYCITGENERAIGLRGSSGDPLCDVCRIEIDAGVGASAQVSLDPSQLDGTEAPVPRFVVRNGRIAVSGLATASERGTGTESNREPGLS